MIDTNSIYMENQDTKKEQEQTQEQSQEKSQEQEQRKQEEQKELTSQKKSDAFKSIHEFLLTQKKHLAINEVDLNSEYSKQSPSFLEASMRYARALHIQGELENELKELHAKVDEQIRKNPTVKMTEAAVEQAILREKNITLLRSYINDAKYQTALYKGLMDSWAQKKDMLIQLGSTDRAAFKAGVSARSQSETFNNMVNKTEEYNFED